MKITAITSFAGLHGAFSATHTYDLPPEIAKPYIACGYAAEVKEAEVETPEEKIETEIVSPIKEKKTMKRKEADKL